MSLAKRFLLMLMVIAGIAFIYIKTKGSTLWGKTYFVVFDKVNGFGKNDPVYFKGTKVGTIKKADFTSDGNYIVELFLTKKTVIPIDSKATVLFTHPISKTYVMNIVAGTSSIMLSQMDTLRGDNNIPLKERAPLPDTSNYDITKDTNLRIITISPSGDTIDLKLGN